MSRMTVSPVNDGGPCAVLTNVAENTSSHGIPNAYRAHSGARKVIWTLLFMAGFSESNYVIWLMFCMFLYSHRQPCACSRENILYMLSICAPDINGYQIGSGKSRVNRYWQCYIVYFRLMPLPSSQLHVKVLQLPNYKYHTCCEWPSNGILSSHLLQH